MSRVVHFELVAEDPERATKFYSDAFGWTTQKWGGPEPYWLVTTGEDGQIGINGGIMRGPDMQKTVITIGVEDVDAACARLGQAGGEVVQPKMTIPGIGYLAYCKDTEGVMFGVIQPDSSAA